MPGGDGTGPRGRGPMSGRGRGQGRGRGWGRYGRGWGQGRGRGWGRHGWGWASPGAYPNKPQNVSPQQEADMLREQAKAMQEALKSINARISELESLKKKSK